MRKILALAVGIAIMSAVAAPANAATSWAGARFAHVHTVGVGALSIIGVAAFMTGYEALVCKTQHVDPLNMGCKHMSWRDPAWRGPRH